MRSEYHEGSNRDQAMQVSRLRNGERSEVIERSLYSMRLLTMLLLLLLLQKTPVVMETRRDADRPDGD